MFPRVNRGLPAAIDAQKRQNEKMFDQHANGRCRRFIWAMGPLRSSTTRNGWESWRPGPAALPTPRSILIVSAHWESAPLGIGTTQTGRAVDL